ncbi:NON-SPECIFIC PHOSPHOLIPASE C4-RELATED [Salix purpurea]|uniref:NON-SPECIFIC PHOSPHOLIPASE C4-RELATED n=1 Tax=Salix purpurea TaxID=77065 RepID=A0A9Q0W9Y1_SALPP|nr:NON-SPECIFIC PHOSPHOLIPASE C4-RELATED [Salix purpurea]
MVAESSSASAAAPSPIKTVVVLVQENRSFDHMVGWLKSINPEINGATGSESNPISTSDSNSSLVFYGDEAAYVDLDPGHSIQDIYEQVFGAPWTEASLSDDSKVPPKMNGFAQNAERLHKGMAQTVMNGFKPDAVPVYKELAENFAICDRWFASVPASTQPNRLYVHSATSHGATSNNRQLLIEGYPQKTLFESLEEAGFTFGIYYQYPPATLFYRNLRKLKYLTKFHQFDLHFKRHCEEGSLPNYVVIEQRFFDLLSIPANDDHPSHDVSEALMTLLVQLHTTSSLIVLVFEFLHFSYLPGLSLEQCYMLPSGPYPTSEFEHSSIAATVKKIFNLKEFLTKRDAWAGTFEGILTRASPRVDCPVTLVEPVKLREGAAKEDAKLSEFQVELVEMAAVLNGDLKKDIYPQQLVDGLNVSVAAKYVDSAFSRFCDECDKAKKNGVEESEIICLEKPATKSKSFAHKLFSCLVCGHN